MANTKVTGDVIANGTISTVHLADNAITSDKITGITTAHITEGSNLYYTDTRVRAAISVNGNALSYDSSTGVITSNYEESPTFTGNITFGDSHFIGDDADDNLLIQSSANENIIINSVDDLLLRTSGTTKLTVKNGGNVGIGTTSPSSRLQVKDSQDSSFDSGIGIIRSASSQTGYINMVGGAFNFNAPSGVPIRFRDGGTVNVTIDGSGNVGIGTTSPDYKLTVNGSTNNVFTYSTGANDQPGFVAANNTTTGTSTNTLYNKFYGPSVSATVFGTNIANYALIGTEGSINNGILLGTLTAKPLIIGTSNTERMRIDSSGIIGINKSSGLTAGGFGSPKIVIKQSANNEWGGINIEAEGNDAVFGIGTSNDAHILAGSYRTTAGYKDIIIKTGGAERLRVDSTQGYIGIGTTSPSEIFHVNKNATSRIVGAYLTNSQANTGAEAVSIAFGLNRSGGDFVRKVEAIEFGATQQWTGTPSTVNSYLAFNVVKSETVYERMRVTTDGVDVTSSGAHGVHLKPDTADTNNSGRLFLTRIGGSGWAVMNNSTNFSIRSGAIAGSTSGTEKIRLTGYSATSWTSGSDETMKENIIAIGDVLDKIQNYRCVEYNLIDDETKDKKIGFIAQDWQEDFPQIIEQMENEKIGMKYTETIPILLKAIQELKAEIETLKLQING